MQQLYCFYADILVVVCGLLLACSASSLVWRSSELDIVFCPSVAIAAELNATNSSLFS